MPTKTNQPGLAGQTVVNEAAALLQELQFSAQRGAYAEGEHVAVSVDPRWNTGNDSIRVLISCSAFGHRRVAWDKLPVRITPDATDGMSALARLNARGQALVPNLPLGDYHLSLRLKPARGTTIVFERPERLAAKDVDEQDEEDERKVWQGENEEGDLFWTLEITEDGDVQVSFETNAERLAGHVVEFHLLDPNSTHVLASQRLTLEPTRRPGTWESWCSLGSQIDLGDAYELIFDVNPPDDNT